MAVLPENSSRPGTDKMMNLAKTLCKHVRLYGPAIAAANAGKPGVLAALAAAEAVCSLIPAADAEIVNAFNADFVFKPNDGDTLPGSLAPLVTP